MMCRTSLIYLFMAAMSCIYCQVQLNQQSSVATKPGQTLTLSCGVSGYSVTDTSYCTHWIRQTDGKALEWIGEVCGSGNVYHSDKLKSKFSVSRDTSSSTVKLNCQSLQTEDSAVYYCARGGPGGSFDYWGKGTLVTVSSGAASPPASIFALSQCGSESGFVTLGCVMSGFLPANSQKFEWTDASGNAISEFIQYPDIPKDGMYSKISQIRVKAEDWDAKKKFTCGVEGHKDKSAVAVKPEEIVQSPTLYLTTPSSEEIDQNKTATFACLATDFSPPGHTFKWKSKIGDKEDNLSSFYSFTSPANGNNSATSYLQVSESVWMNPGTKITCIFEHKTGHKTKSVEFSYPQEECEDAGVKLEIAAPSIEDLLVRKEGWVTCKITGKVSGVLKDDIEWRRDGKDVVWIQADNTVEDGDTMTIKLKVSFEEWQSGKEFSCFVPHSKLASGLTETIKRQNGGPHSKPSVFLMPPPEHDLSDSMTLTCYAKDFYPKEVFVSWLANDEPVTDKSKQDQTDVIDNGEGKYSVYSQLTISRDDWDDGVVFSCVVYHESSEATVRMITRSMDKASQKPNIVSLNMNLPQCRSG